MPNNETTFKWKFHRLGGLDQLTLRTSEELCHLGELDPKLWVALSCPASGLEFDQRVLNLIDSDNDGRIRVPEVVAAVEWTCARLNDAASMIDPPESMPLSLIKTDSEEGSRLLLSAKAVLQSLGKPETHTLTDKAASSASAEEDRNPFKGAGFKPAHESFSAETS